MHPLAGRSSPLLTVFKAVRARVEPMIRHLRGHHCRHGPADDHRAGRLLLCGPRVSPVAVCGSSSLFDTLSLNSGPFGAFSVKRLVATGMVDKLGDMRGVSVSSRADMRSKSDGLLQLNMRCAEDYIVLVPTAMRVSRRCCSRFPLAMPLARSCQA